MKNIILLSFLLLTFASPLKVIAMEENEEKRPHLIPQHARVCVFNPQGQFVHPIRRLRHYLSGCSIEEVSDFEGLSQSRADVVFTLLTDQLVNLPKWIEQQALSDLPEDGFLLKTLQWEGKTVLVAAGGGLPGLISFHLGIFFRDIFSKVSGSQEKRS